MARTRRRVLPGPPNHPLITIQGSRGGGKSAAKESIEQHYYQKKKYLTLSLWASMDLENAHWPIPDVYYVKLNQIPGFEEFKLAKFCRQKYGLAWFKLRRTKVNGKKVWVRNYRLEKDGNVLKVASLDGVELITLTTSADGRKVTVDIERLETASSSSPSAAAATAGRQQQLLTHRSKVELTPEMREFDIVPDMYGNPRVRFPNPDRRDNNWRTVGYPTLIILPDTTTIEQLRPLCVCGQLLADHDQPGYPCEIKLPLIRTISDNTDFKDIVELALRENRVVVFNRGFYDIEEQIRAYRVVYSYIQQIPFLVTRKLIPPNVSICLGLQELGTLVPKRLKALPGTGITEIKRAMIYFLNEARHFRTTIVVDYQAGDEILNEVVSKKDLAIVKKSTKDIIPASLQWFYDEIVRRHQEAEENDEDQQWPLVEDLKPWQCYVVYPDGQPRYELRETNLPQFKHKGSSDDWEYLADCRIHFDLEAINRRKKGGKSARPMSQEEILRERAFERIKELKNEHPDWDWAKLGKEAALFNTKTGKLMDGEGTRNAYKRWLERKAQEAIEGDGRDPAIKPQNDEDLR